MFSSGHKSRIKNVKILRWRIELSLLSYTIVYRKGSDNLAADALSRPDSYCNAIGTDALHEIHKSLCHPGVARMTHFVRSRNLPYSVDEIKQMTNRCSECAELKPRFLNHQL